MATIVNSTDTTAQCDVAVFAKVEKPLPVETPLATGFGLIAMPGRPGSGFGCHVAGYNHLRPYWGTV
jgi:hypothetical protein